MFAPHHLERVILGDGALLALVLVLVAAKVSGIHNVVDVGAVVAIMVAEKWLVLQNQALLVRAVLLLLC